MRPDGGSAAAAAPAARLYFDEDADARLARALQRRGYEVETAASVGLLEASDDEQLAHAAGQRLALVTHNIRHFPGTHAAWLSTGRGHWGIIILIGQADIGAWLRRMEKALHLFSAEDLQNPLLFLGAEYDSPT